MAQMRWRSRVRRSSIACPMPRRGHARRPQCRRAGSRWARAALRLLTNSTLFGPQASRTIAVSKIQFYSRLPASVRLRDKGISVVEHAEIGASLGPNVVGFRRMDMGIIPAGRGQNVVVVRGIGYLSADVGG